MQQIEELKFLKDDKVRELASNHGTPIYVYSKSALTRAAEEVKSAFADIPFGLTIRYAMKANPHPQILKLFEKQGLYIDASSEFEVYDALKVGVSAKKILLTSQQPPKNMKEFVSKNISYTATSLHQLELYGKAAPSTKVSIRLNTGLGSGANHRLTTGGIEVGFGVWFHQDENRGQDIKDIADKYNLEIERLHIHIGTGSDPAIWAKLMDAGLKAVEAFESVEILNLGGGFKLGYMSGEESADLIAIAKVASKKLIDFEKLTGRKIHLEIEPGRYLTARAGSIISTIIDKTNTGAAGDDFLKLDSGMTEIVRTAMYGSQHPLVVVPKNKAATTDHRSYVVIGHCCESSDLLTSSPDNPEKIEPRLLRSAEIEDYMVTEMAGAYCASMSTKGYNSFPVAKEIVID